MRIGMFGEDPPKRGLADLPRPLGRQAGDMVGDMMKYLRENDDVKITFGV